MIEPTNSKRPPLAANLDLETMAAVELHDAAKNARQLAREMRKDAQRDRIEHLRTAAAKLREMASNAISSAIWQGMASFASAACSTISAVGGLRASQLADAAKGARDAGNTGLADALKKLADNRALSSSLWATGGKLAEAAGRIDPYSISSQFLQVEKADQDTHAEIAGNRAQEQGDLESEARRIAESATQLAQKLGEARHAAAMASLRA